MVVAFAAAGTHHKFAFAQSPNGPAPMAACEDVQVLGVAGDRRVRIFLEGANALACAGRAPLDTGDRLHAHTVSLFERALRWIG